MNRNYIEFGKGVEGYMTISFSYVYLKGLHLGIGPSSPVVIEVHLLNLRKRKERNEKEAE